MKKALAYLLIFAILAPLHAVIVNFPSLYNDTRIMAMGNANIAIGGYSSSIFYNPAGLSTIPFDNSGYQIELLGLETQVSEDLPGFLKDLQHASDSDDTQQVTDVLAHYSGNDFNVKATNFSSYSQNLKDWTYLGGLYFGASADFLPHGRTPLSGNLMDLNLKIFMGTTGGVSKTFDSVGPGNLYIALSGNFIHQLSYSGGLTAQEIINHSDDMLRYLENKYKKSGSAFAPSLGLIYALLPESVLRPSIGLSAMNLGGLYLGGQYGSTPGTLNAGVALNPKVPLIESLQLAVDYIDMLNAYDQVSTINYTTQKSIIIKDDGWQKRLRYGMKAGLFKNSWTSISIAAGVYQNSLTAGADWQLSIIDLAFTTYAENYGTSSVPMYDRRYMLRLGVAW